ncbi:MAG: hypothetical protein ACE5LB_11300 [Acidiferrobacterales bacterium]
MIEKRYSRVAVVLTAAFLLGILSASASSADRVALRIDGNEVALNKPVQQSVATQLAEILKGCWYAHGDASNVQTWQRVSSGSHLHISYAEPFPVTVRDIARQVSEAIWELPDTNFPGWLLARHGDAVGLYGKCDGQRILKLICMSGLKEYLPVDYARNCHLVR